MHAFVQGQGSEIFAAPDVPVGNFSLELVQLMYRTLHHDRAAFELADRYVKGDQAKPYAPSNPGTEIDALQKLSIANVMKLTVQLPAEVSYVDDYRRGGEPNLDQNGMPKTLPEWDTWQKNRMDARQSVLYVAACKYGQAFLCVDNIDPKNIRLDILPTRNTVAYFRDPVNDIRPSHVLTIKTRALNDTISGLAVLWDDKYRWELEYTIQGQFNLKGKPFAHGLGACPVVRYPCLIDDEGRTSGLVLPNIPHQDRINQATFNTNVTANFGSFKVRYAAGLQVQFREDPNNPGQPQLDPVTKRPIPIPVEVSQSRFLMSPDPNVTFGQLDETPLDGYLAAEERAFENFTTLVQFPPLAQVTSVANLSAEALAALETQFMRFCTLLQTTWGESHEEIFRILAAAHGDKAGAESFGGEVRWRDMGAKSMGIIADAFGKLKAQVGVPGQALWSKIPGTTRGDMKEWAILAEREREDQLQLAKQQSLAGAAQREQLRPSQIPTQQQDQSQPPVTKKPNASGSGGK